MQSFQSVSDFCTKMVVWRFTSDEVVHFIMDILGDGDESGEENMLGEEGDAEVDPEDDSGSDGDYPEESVKEVNKPSISRGWGRGRGRNMRRGGCGCGRGRRQQAQGAAEQQACGNIDTCTQRLSGYNRQHGPTQHRGAWLGVLCGNGLVRTTSTKWKQPCCVCGHLFHLPATVSTPGVSWDLLC